MRLMAVPGEQLLEVLLILGAAQLLRKVILVAGEAEALIPRQHMQLRPVESLAVLPAPLSWLAELLAQLGLQELPEAQALLLLHGEEALAAEAVVMGQLEMVVLAALGGKVRAAEAAALARIAVIQALVVLVVMVFVL